MYGYELQNSDYYYNTLNENNEIEVNTPCGVISVYIRGERDWSATNLEEIYLDKLFVCDGKFPDFKTISLQDFIQEEVSKYCDEIFTLACEAEREESRYGSR